MISTVYTRDWSYLSCTSPVVCGVTRHWLWNGSHCPAQQWPRPRELLTSGLSPVTVATPSVCCELLNPLGPFAINNGHCQPPAIIRVGLGEQSTTINHRSSLSPLGVVYVPVRPDQQPTIPCLKYPFLAET